MGVPRTRYDRSGERCCCRAGQVFLDCCRRHLAVHSLLLRVVIEGRLPEVPTRQHQSSPTARARLAPIHALPAPPFGKISKAPLPRLRKSTSWKGNRRPPSGRDSASPDTVVPHAAAHTRLGRRRVGLPAAASAPGTGQAARQVQRRAGG